MSHSWFIQFNKEFQFTKPECQPPMWFLKWWSKHGAQTEIIPDTLWNTVPPKNKQDPPLSTRTIRQALNQFVQMYRVIGSPGFAGDHLGFLSHRISSPGVVGDDLGIPSASWLSPSLAIALGILAFTISASSRTIRLGGSWLLFQHRQTSISASRLLLLLHQLSVPFGTPALCLNLTVGLAPLVGLGCSSNTARPRRCLSPFGGFRSSQLVWDSLFFGSMTSTKLKGSNYLQWSRAVLVFLTGRGKESYLTTTKPTDATKISKWIKEDAQIMTSLWNSLKPDVFNNVSYLESSKDIWDTLHLINSKSTREEFRVVKFLSGLKSNLDPIRSQILSGKDIPTVRETYARGERGDHSSRRGNHNGRGSRGGHSGGGGRGPRKCIHCGRTNHTIDFCWKLHGKPAWANHATVDGDNSTPISEEQVLISKAEYDSILQRASSSSMVASGNTCLHSSSSPPWVIDSGASDHMTGNSSLLSNILNPCSPFSVTVANGTKTPVQGIGTVSTPNLTFSNDLKTKRMIGGGIEKDRLYFRPFHTSIPSALRSFSLSKSVALPSWTPLGGQLQESILSSPVIPTPIPFSPQAPPISQIHLFLSLPSDLDLPIALRKEEALSHPGWRKAMEEEMHALDLNHTWDLVHKPAGTSIIGCRWVFTVKQNPDGTVDRLKARLVAKGFTQTYGLDYTETFSPVAKLNSIRIIISLAANLDWPLHQLDVKNVFLHGDLNETVYMAQPPGFESKGEYVCHLKKSIYGLKQSPRAWFDKFSKAVVSHGMTRSQADHSIFFKKTKTGIVILVVYVDDIVITGSDKEGIQILIDHLSSSFLTKYLGKLHYFLGIEVARSKAGISLSQRKYTLDILQDTGYLGSKPVATSMESNLKLMLDEGDFIDDPDTYRRLAGKLIYLTITRPDISYAVSVMSQFMISPRVPHMNAIIRILKYLKNAPGHGLFYRSSGHLRIEGGNLVTWRSKKQSVVARSSAEAEYRAMAHTTCELTWLRTVLQEFGLLTQGPTPLYCDNQAAIHIASNPVFHERTKDIKVACHFVRSKVESKDIITPFVSSGSQLSDIFTKALLKDAIDSICSKLGGKVGRWTRAYHLKVPPPPLPPQPPRGGPRQRFLPTPRGVNMIVWSLDNRFVLAAIMDCRICVWNAVDGSLVHSLTGHTESSYVLDVHPFNPRIAMSAGFGRAHPYGHMKLDVLSWLMGSFRRVACGYTTPLQGIGKYAKTIHQQGCDDVACTTNKLFGEAVNAASQADATVLVIGLDQSIEAEFKDRAGLLLPGRQQELVSKVAAASKGPTILVLMSGGPIDLAFAKNDPRIGAILWAGYPGQAGGAAIADILFGAYNPGGGLPMTWYPQDYLTNLPMTTMAMSAPTVVSIPLYGRHARGNTTISGKAIRVTHTKCNRLSLGVQVNVKNIGSKDGSHSLLVFSTPPAGHWAPHKQLVAFEKVHVPARAQHRVLINIHVCKYLSVVDRSGIRRIPMGEHSLHIGNTKHSVSLQAAKLGVIKS
uniref:Fibronectin type III-like domain-containing protein n=1 Tax=Fagus sylvatica TaxID=28930 RepID=A0A2N9IR39_FAGSY